MDLLYREFIETLPNLEQFIRITVRLLAAALLGAITGYERERAGKPAGLRTHMLVALGSAVFVIAPLELGMAIADVSRIVQGLAAGIGFIGAGAILKRGDGREVEGLTTAATVWLTAGVGMAIGLGALGVAALATALSWVVLSILGRLEERARD